MYIHDLVQILVKLIIGTIMIKKLTKTDGNTYPTHGLGPLAHLFIEATE